MDNIQWTFIPDTNNSYLILNDGRVFSRKLCGYLKLETNVNGFYRVFIKKNNDVKRKHYTIYKLLQESFPESLEHEEYYLNKNFIEYRKMLLKELNNNE